MTSTAVPERKAATNGHLPSIPDAEPSRDRLNHIELLEAESIHIFREVVSEFQNPVMLYSIGKDSSVMLRLAQKAFHPGPIPFPLLHVDTGYKFREMLEFRDRYTAELGLKLIVWRNEEALADGANPVKLGTQRCCGLLKTQALLDGLRSQGFDADSAGLDAMKKSPAPRSASFLSAMVPDNGTRRIKGPNSGHSSMAKSVPARASVSSLSPTGPNSISGITSTLRRSPSSRSISPSLERCWSGPIP